MILVFKLTRSSMFTKLTFLLQTIGNYPPEITDILEVSDTSALENETLSVIVNETYSFDVIAHDTNENDILTYYLNGTVPGASIDNSKTCGLAERVVYSEILIPFLCCQSVESRNVVH